MYTVADLCRFLEGFAPLHLAEEWDNVGLLVGDRGAEVHRVMTCLTLTVATVAEAVRERADLVVAHHPLPFKPVQRITSDSTPGRLLLELIGAKVAVFSPHSALDSAALGINQHLAARLGLVDVQPLVPAAGEAGQPNGERLRGLGSGRWGKLKSPATLAAFAAEVKRALGVEQVQVVGDLGRQITRVGIGCGSGGSFLGVSHKAGCDVLLTGETNLHTCYEAEATGMALVLAGHYATERFHLDHLAEVIRTELPSLEVWASRDERDPLLWV